MRVPEAPATSFIAAAIAAMVGLSGCMTKVGS